MHHRASHAPPDYVIPVILEDKKCVSLKRNINPVSNFAAHPLTRLNVSAFLILCHIVCITEYGIVDDAYGQKVPIKSKVLWSSDILQVTSLIFTHGVHAKSGLEQHYGSTNTQTLFERSCLDLRRETLKNEQCVFDTSTSRSKQRSP